MVLNTDIGDIHICAKSRNDPRTWIPAQQNLILILIYFLIIIILIICTHNRWNSIQISERYTSAQKSEMTPVRGLFYYF